MKKSKTMKKLTVIMMMLLSVLPACLFGADVPAAPAQPERWPAEKACNWYKSQPWLVGCNFLPSTAVNDVEMWQADTFDPVTIERDLAK